MLTIGLPVAAAMAAAGPAGGVAAERDTVGAALVAWAYDSWTSPWVQVAGDPLLLSPGSHATLVVLDCATADLERERAARHLSAEECEHRMAAIRADQDTALVFRLELRVFDFPGAGRLARMASEVRVTLEDDRGRRFSPEQVMRGPALATVAEQTLRKLPYQPPWERGAGNRLRRYAAVGGRGLLVAEHRVRFSRHDPETGEPVVSSRTRWLSLRLLDEGNEWVATWAFRSPEDAARDARR